MKDDSIVILGANILGLYSAIKLIDSGYTNIIVIDKNLTLGRIKTNNHIFFHKNHLLYIDLLKRFNIKFVPVNIVKNTTIQNILTNIINKSKYIPHKILICQTFLNFTKNILSLHDYNYLKENITSFEVIFEKINETKISKWEGI
jgi:heterodisulfide reductase subunit A-like polyferredoxin